MKKLIIDIHGHYTSAPPEIGNIRASQLTEMNRPVRHELNIPDEQIAATLQKNLEVMDERGISHVLLSPTASKMGHHFGNEKISMCWTQLSNDLTARVCRLYPERFSGICQLPQSPGISPANCLEELERCITDLGFVGCIDNPDDSGGVEPLTPSVGDEYWYPLWEKLTELDVPAMIHASSTLVPNMHPNGSHYIVQDFAAVVELCASRVFLDFPQLKLIVPHGGGALPFQYNRQRAILEGGFMKAYMPFEESLKHLYFDTAVYDRDSLEMIFRKLGTENTLFASEMFGTGAAQDPQTGRAFDDIVPVIQGMDMFGEQEKEDIFCRNALKIYPRLERKLKKYYPL